MNFFEWIRNGVRRAVLLGVSDAVEDLGPPPGGEDDSDSRRQLLQYLRGSAALVSPDHAGPNPKPRRLGRTLTQAQASQAKPSG